MRTKLKGIGRYIATPRVAKYRLFVWLPEQVIPDSRLFAFARQDDFFFGILSSKQHQCWSLATCSWHGVGNDPTYNASTCFETFPFPLGLTPDIAPNDYVHNPRVVAIAAAAKQLNDYREAWLNPPDWIVYVPKWRPAILIAFYRVKT